MLVLRGHITLNDRHVPIIITDEYPLGLELTPHSMAKNPPMGKTIEALFSESAGLLNLEDWQYDLTALPEHDVRRVGLTFGYGVSPEVFPDLESDDYVKRTAKDIKNEYLRIAGGRVDIEVYPVNFPTIITSDGYFGVDWPMLRYMSDQAYPNKRLGDTHYGCITSSGISNSSLCGRADLNGPKSWSKSWCVYKKSTHIHETLGHSLLGVSHSGQGQREYAENSTWMGLDRLPGVVYDFNTPHLIEAGLIEDNNIIGLESGESVETWLVQGSRNPLSLRTGENKAVMCNTGDSTNKSVCVSFYNGVVAVHVPWFEGTKRWVITRLLRYIETETQYEFDDIVVRVEKLNKYSAKVRVFNKTSTAPTPTITEPIWWIGDSSPITKNLAGQWGNKQWSVQGVHVGFTDDNRVVLHWLTWKDREHSQHQWFWAVCDVEGTVAKGTIVTANPEGEISELGEIMVYWHNDTTGIMRGEIEGYGPIAVPLQRISQASEHSMNGYYGIGNNEGMTISVDSKGHAILYWLLHDTEGNKLWRMLSGPLDDLKIYSVDGGQFAIKSDFEINSIGTGSVENGQILFNITGQPPDQRTLRRLV